MECALGINVFRLPRHNQNPSMRVFPGQLLNPEDAVAIFQKWFDQQNIGAMFLDEFAGIKETMRAAADLIPLITPDDRSHAGLADARISHHHDPIWLFARASYRAIFHCFGELNC